MASSFSFLLSIFVVLINMTASKSSCHDNERSALLQFKQSFVTDKLASADPSAYPKVSSWDTYEDCCLWDGVECDEQTYHVIGLNLASSFLYGSINSSSGLFQLVHLQMLRLGDNNFNLSQIPPQIVLLSNLTYLDLSNSVFSGHIPSEITQLSNLTLLNLGGNAISPMGKLLRLEQSVLKWLVQNLTNLETLDLRSVNISSTLPDVFSDLHSLKFLSLADCNLRGCLPSSLGNLSNLDYLNLGSNNFSGQLPPSLAKLNHLFHLILNSNQLTGQLPQGLSNLTQLTDLDLNCNNLQGPIPESFATLLNLDYVNLENNKFSGLIPSWLANLTQLSQISLAYNNFNGDLSWLGKQNKLSYLSLWGNNLVGEIPSSLRNLTQLQSLVLAKNQLAGNIPSWISNLTQLTVLYLGPNKFHGPIPESFSGLVNLQVLNLQQNHLIGVMKLDMFTSLKQLTFLHVNGNNLSVLTEVRTNTTLPMFKHLGLGDCNLSHLPDFLRHQHELSILDLSSNKMQGLIPEWLGSVSQDTLEFLDLSNNLLTGVEQSSALASFTRLRVLFLYNNKLQGPLPVPPVPIEVYTVKNNSLTGKIRPSLCNMGSLISLDLSYNNFTGVIPSCLGKFNDSKGKFRNGANLKMIDVSHNQLIGELPRSLANCGMLRILDVSANHISDKFPSWLRNLPDLQVLSLRSNQFYGSIATVSGFTKLRIVDLSLNNFTGILPSEFFRSLSSMKLFDASQFTYMHANQTEREQGNDQDINSDFTYDMILANKGFYRKYEKIPNVMVAIDLSSNRFEGEIPTSIGTLKMLNVLNLSHNSLTGQIPIDFGKLANLESLDLSNNSLSGAIPFQLRELTFLEYFNVSYNQLQGHIPEGKQFNTFDNSSYLGNSGLCGNPLSQKCEDVEPSPPSDPTSGENKDFNLPAYFDWLIVLIGYGCGLVVGVIVGYKFPTRNHEWLLKTFRERQGAQRRREG